MLDPNICAGPYIIRSLHPLMHDWSSRRHAAKDLISSILAPMFPRLASDHEQLLAYEPAVQESADMVVQPEQAALVWQLIAGETRTELWTFLLIFSSAISQLQAHLLYIL